MEFAGHYLVLLLPLVFVAYFLKATTGFGSMIVMLAIGSLIIGPFPALLLTTTLDVIGGLILLRLDSTRDSRNLWQPLSLAMMLGVITGALLLRFLALNKIHYLIASALLAVGLWLIFFRPRPKNQPAAVVIPTVASKKDLFVCLLAGTSGGLTGISAPPVIYHFGRSHGKETLRRILTRVFLVESITRVLSYSALGAMRMSILVLGLAAVPFMLIGLYVGNRVFFRIPETWFSRAAGVVAILSAARLLTS